MKHIPNTVKDFLVSGEEFQLVADKKIEGLLCTLPVPIEENLSKYYESEKYISHSDSSQGLISWLYYQVKKFNLKQKRNLIGKVASGKKILDYGCGTGEFVSELNRHGFKGKGFEPGEKAFEIADNKNPDLIYKSDTFLQTEKFDVITLWHVLEHIPNLEVQTEKIISALNHNGRLFIAVPNYRSYDAKNYADCWAAYDVPRHLWHFDQGAMHQLFGQFGMIIEKVEPMYFDAFYVSMLSEKYRGSSNGFLRGFVAGLISNLKAARSGEFSSLIYQIRRKN